MRVVCDNCGATYKIPESKLTKEVNKATCRKCGHRMLIRRAISAPPPAPPPAAADGEHTQIRRPPPAAANEWADDGPTRIARAPEDENERPTVAMEEPPPVVPAPPPAATPSLPRPVVPKPAVPVAAPRPAPVAPAPVAPAPVAPAPAPVAPAPVAPAPAAPAAPAHHAAAFDPSGDLTWAALGSLIAVAGALALAFNITSSATLRTVGLALALGGSLLSLFVLLTGGRGLKKANLGVSLVFAAILGVGTAAVIHGVFTSLYGMNESIEMAASRGAPPAPVEADPADDDVLAALAEPGGLAEVEEVEPEAVEDEEPVAVVAAATPPPRRETRAAAAPIRGSGTDVAPARSEPRAEPAPARVAPAAAPAPPPEPAPKKQMTRLPTSVVETMIRNNKRIKRCWMEEKQRSGELPKRVDVKFTVQPSGAVSSARSATKKYRGTDFEVCLGSAFRSITFPPFDGDPLSMTYNFAL